MQQSRTISRDALSLSSPPTQPLPLLRARALLSLAVMLCLSTLTTLGCNSPSSSPSTPQQNPPSDKHIAKSQHLAESMLAQNGGAVGGNDPAASAPTLNILRKSLVMVQRRYYDQARIKPSLMIAHGVDALQADLPEVVAAFNKPLEDEPTSFELRVNDQRKTFDISKVTDLSDVAGVCDEILGFVLAHSTKPQESNELEYTLINGMLGTLDPHSALLTPKAYDDMQTSHGGFGGLGIVIGIRDELLTVISPIEGTPASRAGIKSGDNIVQIGEESTINMPLHEAVDRMRGEPSTTVEIFVTRKGWSEPRSFKITREMISIRSLIHEPLAAEKIAYIKIKSFERNTGEDVQAKLEEMKAAMGGELKGVILDLRYNAGGLLTQAIAVADAFLKTGDIVASEGVGGADREEHAATDDGKEPSCPVIVITNPGSASASEIVAGALKNHNRAILLGETTFGKGSVQILRDFEDGSALKLTVAQYLIPGDVSIQGLGVTPDIQVTPVAITEEDGLLDMDLYPSEHIRREGSLDLSLSTTKARAEEKPSLYLKYLYDPKAEEGRSGEAFFEDYEIILAKQILLAASDPDRAAMIKSSAPTIAAAEAEQTLRITEALAKYKVDWQAPPSPIPSQPFNATLALTTPSARAGETVTLRATVTNTGTQPIHRLYAVSESNNLVFEDREFLFGYVAPGESRTWEYSLKIPRGQETRRDIVKLAFADINGKLTTAAQAPITIDGLPEPHFAFSYALTETKGNGDGRFQIGESLDMSVWVQNNGEGTSDNALAYLKNESGPALYLSKGRETIGAVPHNEWKPALMRFDLNGTKKDAAFAEFKLTVYDKDFGVSLERTVQLPVQDLPDITEKLTGNAAFTADAPVYGAAINEPQFILASAKKGQKVEQRTLNKTRNMIQVAWKQGSTEVIGWVEAASLKADAGGAPESLTLLGTHAAPRIEFTGVPLEATDSTLKIKGKVADDGKVSDYYVYLWHRDGQKTHSEKLDYQLINKASGEFVVNLPLRTGINRVRMIVRDDETIESLRDVYVSKP